MSQGAASEALVKFEDVIIYFSRDEWAILEKWQKDLYWEVLKDNYEALVSVGYPVTKIDILAWIEQHECLNGNGAQQSKASSSSGILSPCPSNQRLAQMCHKECMKQAGSLQVICGTSKGDTALRNDIGGRHSQRTVVPLKQYECGECGKKFPLKSLLQIHQKVGVKEVPYHCPECEMCFLSSSCLRVHQRTHFQGCRERRKGCLQENCLSMPQEKHRALEKLHCCTDCGQSFHRYLNFLQHRKSHEVTKPWPCIQCGNVFMSQSDLVMHEESHLEEAMQAHFACGRNCVCESSLRLHFASQVGGGKIGLENHKRLPQEFYVKEGKPYSCVHCGLQFKLEVNLGVHYRYCPKGKLLNWRVNGTPQDLKVHTEQGYHRLVPAGRNGTSAELTLRRHRQKHRGGKQRDSDKHDRSVTSADSSGSLQKSCAVKKLHKCEDCGKRFVYKWQLAIHLKTHTVGKGYLCPHCGKSFAHKSSLWSHSRMHQGKATYNEENSQEHLVPAGSRRTGKGKPLYPCDKCGNSFTKSYMRCHQAFHDGVRYRCLFCGKVSNFRSGAIAHLKHHRAKGDFSACPICKGKGELPSTDCLCSIQQICIAPGLEAQDGKGMSLHTERGKRISSTSRLNFRWHVRSREKQHSEAEGQKNSHRKQEGKPFRNTRPRPFRCRDCGKDFAYVACLMNHRRIHRGGFPFQCAECGKSFPHRSYLNMHWKKHAKKHE